MPTKQGKTIKKKSKSFKHYFSTVQNVGKKLQLGGTVEINTRLGDKIKLQYCWVEWYSKIHVIKKDLQVGLANTGVLVLPSTV